MSGALDLNTPEPTPNPEPTNNDPAPKGEGDFDWRSHVPEELKDDPSLTPIKDLGGLVKSYVHAQRAVGSDKIPVPGKHATDEDWSNVYKKLGLPESVDKFELKVGDPEKVDKEFLQAFKAEAHKAGILPKQAQAMFDWYQKTVGDKLEAQTKQQEHEVETQLEAYKKERGAAYDKDVRLARKALSEFGDDELFGFLEKSGLTNNVHLIKAFAKAGEAIAEDSVDGEGNQGNELAPDEAGRRYAELIASPEALDPSHPGHAAAVAEMEKLTKFMNYKSA